MIQALLSGIVISVSFFLGFVSGIFSTLKTINKKLEKENREIEKENMEIRRKLSIIRENNEENLK